MSTLEHKFIKHFLIRHENTSVGYLTRLTK